jgi:uncharacterized membrane protein SirB2
MTTIVFLKFFHYVSIFLAGGLGVANAILFKNHQKAEMAPAPPVQQTMTTLARLGLISIVVLWLSGLPMTILLYGSFDLGWPFYLKIFGATTLLAVVAFLNIHLIKQARTGNPPNPKLMKVVPPIARTSLVLVFIGIAVLTTSI